MHRVRHLRQGTGGGREGEEAGTPRGGLPTPLSSFSPPQKCPFDAIMIINLPKNLESETTHR